MKSAGLFKHVQGPRRRALWVGVAKWPQKWLEKKEAGRGPWVVNAPLPAAALWDLKASFLLPKGHCLQVQRLLLPPPGPTQPPWSLPPWVRPVSPPPWLPPCFPLTPGFPHQSEQYISCGKRGGFNPVAASFLGSSGEVFMFYELPLGGRMEGWKAGGGGQLRELLRLWARELLLVVGH